MALWFSAHLLPHAGERTRKNDYNTLLLNFDFSLKYTINIKSLIKYIMEDEQKRFLFRQII